MSKYGRIVKENLGQIKKMQEEGKTLNEIGAVFGVKKATLSYCLINQDTISDKISFREAEENKRDEIISLYNGGMTCVELGKKFGIDNSTMGEWLSRWGVDPTKYSCNKENRFVADFGEEVIDGYLGGKTLKELREEFGFTTSCIKNYLNRNGIDTSIKYKYEVDNNYWENIDSEVKAYHLGWMFSDGNVSNSMVRIEIQKKDSYVLKNISKIGGNNGGFYNRRETNKTQPCICWQVARIKWAEDLLKLGCMEAKSHKIGMPIGVSDELFPHFLRGEIDGDGSVYCDRGQTGNFHGYLEIAGYTPFLEGIARYLKDKNVIENFKIYTRGDSNKNGRLCILQKKDYTSLHNYIYPQCFNPELCLWRKYVKYNTLLGL